MSRRKRAIEAERAELVEASRPAIDRALAELTRSHGTLDAAVASVVKSVWDDAPPKGVRALVTDALRPFFDEERTATALAAVVGAKSEVALFDVDRAREEVRAELADQIDRTMNLIIRREREKKILTAKLVRLALDCPPLPSREDIPAMLESGAFDVWWARLAGWARTVRSECERLDVEIDRSLRQG